jgi:hypothetical protein
MRNGAALGDLGLELTDDECRALLRTASVGRVGVSVNALPVILPVNYRLTGDTIRFWSPPGLKLHAAHAQHVVAFEVDEFGEDHQGGWSVLAVGLAAEVEDPDIVDSTVRDGFRPPVGRDDDHLIEASIVFLSGRRIMLVSTTPPDGAW